MEESQFETFEENGTHWARGSVFVIALVDRDTLKLKSYVQQAFVTEDEAEELINTMHTDGSLAYIIQQKEFMIPIHRSES